jgi:hypothetical protein
MKRLLLLALLLSSCAPVKTPRPTLSPAVLTPDQVRSLVEHAMRSSSTTVEIDASAALLRSRAYEVAAPVAKKTRKRVARWSPIDTTTLFVVSAGGIPPASFHEDSSFHELLNLLEWIALFALPAAAVWWAFLIVPAKRCRRVRR